MAKDLMKCDGCGKEVDSTTTGTCMTAEVEMEDHGMSSHFGAGNFYECPSDYFYCNDCLNQHGFCKTCNIHVKPELQKKIWES